MQYTKAQVEASVAHANRRAQSDYWAEDWLALHAENDRLRAVIEQIERIVTTDRKMSAATDTRILMTIHDEWQRQAALRGTP